MSTTIKSNVLSFRTPYHLTDILHWLLVVLSILLIGSKVARAEIIFVSNQNAHNIQKFDSITGKPLGYVATNIIGSSLGVALDRTGNLYAVFWGSQSIVKFTPDGVASLFTTGLQAPQCLAFDRADNLYVSTGNIWYQSTIMKFTPGGTRSIFATNGLNEPYGMAFDKAGNLYVANSRGQTILKFTPDGVGSVFAAGIRFPFGLAFDDAGNLLASDYWLARIWKVTPDGAKSVLNIPTLDSPAELAFDSAGNLYICDEWGGNYGRIIRFTPAGVSSIFADIPLGGPFSIAIKPLPKLLAAPSIACPELVTLQCTNGSATTTLHADVLDTNGLALRVVWSVNGTAYQTNDIPSGGTAAASNVTFTAIFEEGEHLVTISASNGQTAPASCSTKVTVGDTVQPLVLDLSATPSVLWPANHQMIPVTISVAALDTCDPSPVARIVDVRSTEPDFSFAPDWQITGPLTLNLRAERFGRTDRVYTIFIEVTDASDNLASTSIDVRVAHRTDKR